MKLMVSVFFGEGTFLFRQNKKTQHIFLIWFAFYSARGAENMFFSKNVASNLASASSVFWGCGFKN